uniref:Ankyrin repeat and SOCS box protein 13-like n=1 Tax=Hirondellea gigas TaxID=1518452 RepID=A0A2P2ICD3_9CRUS
MDENGPITSPESRFPQQSMDTAIEGDDNALLPLFPVHEAVVSGDLNYVKEMLYLGGDVNDLHFGGITPLHMACLAGHHEIAVYLIENGALIDSFSVERSTPLCEAAAGGHPRLVTLLLSLGARVNPPLLLATPLHEAALRGNMNGCYEVIEVLLQHGADVVCNDSHHGSPLHAACSKRNPNTSAIKLLLEAGSNPNGLQFHITPLHLIAKNSQCTSSAMLLIFYGANVHLRDNQNRRPIDLVPSARHPLHSLLHACVQEPRSLLLLSRLAVRNCIGKEKLREIQTLNLPVGLRNVLK